MPVTDEAVERARALIASGLSQREACKQSGVPRSSFQARLREGPRAETQGDQGVADSGRVAELPTEDSLMAQMGFSRDEWTVDRAVVSNWGNPAEPMFQLKLWLRKRVPLEWLFPAADVKPVRLEKRRVVKGPQRIVVLGDHQAPYFEPQLHEQSLALLQHFKPDRVVYNGDLMDLPTISRHRDNPPFTATPQDCIESGFRVLRDLREASKGAAWDFLEGNHDQRIKTELLNRAERLYGIRPAEIDGYEEDALSLRRLLHLDRLGICHVRNEGGYEHSEVVLHPELVVRHGWLTGPTAAEKSLHAMGRSVVINHMHSKQHLFLTRHEGPRQVLRQAVVAGAMCRMDLGYNVRSNWHQGLVTLNLWVSGDFTVDHAVFSDGRLRWRGECFA